MEKLTIFSDEDSLFQELLYEMRHVDIQSTPHRFRHNMERFGLLAGYAISKTLHYRDEDVQTPLGIARARVLEDKIVLCAVLRAGLPLHAGLLSAFDKAENGFFAIYRRDTIDGGFEVKLEYATLPRVDGKTVIIADPMLATGLTIEQVLQRLLDYGTPKAIHLVAVIGSTEGVQHIRRLYPQIRIWIGAVDEELTAKAYIVPGLGDAGDLAYGKKA